ncbi:MarR family transcriptional regulator [Actinomadura kijaniata]|uniref:DNA-binding MarR family transcriptional regulator n=1 Tax=Actinomadura namibiensis TaxID=182080 RepID=A0A7W3QPW5_ACTNM|nr:MULTISPECIES: MarR family transcriptional regulator [Actinomadura]MBA8955047.1 DNA-binding MarR family transcriptional regulator [Actinomadura namibiensis]
MPDDPGELDFLSFVDFAVARTTAELPSVDADAMRLSLTLSRLASALVYDWESTVHRPRGLSWSGFRVLFVLWLAGPLEAKRAAVLTGMSRAAVSALVNTLERAGLVTRRPADHDGRAVTLELTDAGHDAITGAFQEHNRRERVLADSLSKQERTQLIGLLEKLMTSPAAAEMKRRS